MEMVVSGKRVALVTGANRGIGLEIAKQLAKKEIRVVLSARDFERVVAVVKELSSPYVIPVKLDVTLQQDVDQVRQKIESDFGRLDILINNAAILINEQDAPTTVGLDAVRTTMEVNLLGAWRLCKAFIPLMKRNDYGRIVNLSSRAGSFARMAKDGGRVPAYSASKAAVNALTVLLASELRGTNILVNAACPGRVRTRMGGWDAPTPVEEGADTPVWLATLPDGGPTGRVFSKRQQVDW